jgi:hypothetical protein
MCVIGIIVDHSNDRIVMQIGEHIDLAIKLSLAVLESSGCLVEPGTRL